MVEALATNPQTTEASELTPEARRGIFAFGVRIILERMRHAGFDLRVVRGDLSIHVRLIGRAGNPVSDGAHAQFADDWEAMHRLCRYSAPGHYWIAEDA